LVIKTEVLEAGHALSREAQPAISSLAKALSGKGRVTLIVGAGFSIDAGLPSWQTLIGDLATAIGEVDGHDMGQMAASDSDDLLRKAEYVLRMRIEAKGYGTPEDLIRTALYEDRKGAVPGPLLRALAQLVASLGDRVTILTTNFDEMLESALETRKVRSKAILNVGLEKWKQEVTSCQRRGVVPIYHLHGRVSRVKNDRTDSIVLTESHFLKHGPRVREIVVEALKSSTTVCLGLSLTDPNLVGPLWDTRKARKPTFAIAVPGAVDGFDRKASSAYFLHKNRYLERELEITPIYLKNYGQLEQFIYEMDLAAKNVRRYLLPADDVNCTAYGARLRRALEGVTTALGSTRSKPVPRGSASEALRKKLAAELGTGEKAGRVSQLLERYSNDEAVTDLLRKLEHKVKAASRTREKFGLQLWVRVPAHGVAHARYEILLAGSSHFVFHPPADESLTTWSVDAHSENMAARALARGRGYMWKTTPEISLGMWQGMFAAPVRLIQTIPSRSGDLRVPLAIGALALTTTHTIQVQREDIPPDSKLSLLSALNAEQRRELGSILGAVGAELLSAP